MLCRHCNAGEIEACVAVTQYGPFPIDTRVPYVLPASTHNSSDSVSESFSIVQVIFCLGSLPGTCISMASGMKRRRRNIRGLQESGGREDGIMEAIWYGRLPLAGMPPPENLTSPLSSSTESSFCGMFAWNRGDWRFWVVSFFPRMGMIQSTRRQGIPYSLV